MSTLPRGTTDRLVPRQTANTTTTVREEIFAEVKAGEWAGRGRSVEDRKAEREKQENEEDGEC